MKLDFFKKDKKNKIMGLAAVVCCLVFIGYYAFFLSPLIARLSTLFQEAAEVQERFNQAEFSVGEMPKVKREIEQLESTSLKVSLLGTVTGDDKNAYAVIEEISNRKQGLYRVGDSVQDAIVKMIFREKVVLRVGGKDQVLKMETPPSTSVRKDRPAPRYGASARSTITVKRADLKRAFEDVNKMLTQIRVQPHTKDGKPDGLAVTQIEPDSIFTRLGLVNGDVVQRVNNRRIIKPDDVMLLYNRLKSGSRASISISRNGEMKTINYRFK